MVTTGPMTDPLITDMQMEFSEVVAHVYNSRHFLRQIHPRDVHTLLWTTVKPHGNWVEEVVVIAQAICKVTQTVCPFILAAPSKDPGPTAA